jgi:hypothetical protein
MGVSLHAWQATIAAIDALAAGGRIGGQGRDALGDRWTPPGCLRADPATPVGIGVDSNATEMKPISTRDFAAP